MPAFTDLLVISLVRYLLSFYYMFLFSPGYGETKIDMANARSGDVKTVGGGRVSDNG